MGCNTCKSECGREDGCGSRKAEQKALLDALVARVYPGRTYGRPDEAAIYRAGISELSARRLQRALSEALRAPTCFRPGGEGDLCSYIYVLCVGREPGLVEVRDAAEGLGLLRGALAPGPISLRERYLRICCSGIARVAAVQEVALELDLGRGQAPEGMGVIREIPLPGVFDAKLLKRFQKTVDFLLASEVQHLDMGLLDVPAAHFGLLPGDYAAQYGVEPALFNYFFAAQPVTMPSAVYLPAEFAEDATALAG